MTYEVTGDGRAINITYVDTGSLLQTEFNVMLPWSKEVELPDPAADPRASPSSTWAARSPARSRVNGAVVQQRTGSGLTICSATG